MDRFNLLDDFSCDLWVCENNPKSLSCNPTVGASNVSFRFQDDFSSDPTVSDMN